MITTTERAFEDLFIALDEWVLDREDDGYPINILTDVITDYAEILGEMDGNCK